MVDNKRTIRVGTLDYELTVKRFDDSTDSEGYVSHQTLTMVLDNSIPRQLQFAALIHEVRHCIAEQLGVDDIVDKTRAVDYMLAQFFSDNKKLIMGVW